MYHLEDKTPTSPNSGCLHMYKSLLFHKSHVNMQLILLKVILLFTQSSFECVIFKFTNTWEGGENPPAGVTHGEAEDRSADRARDGQKKIHFLFSSNWVSFTLCIGSGYLAWTSWFFTELLFWIEQNKHYSPPLVRITQSILGRHSVHCFSFTGHTSTVLLLSRIEKCEVKLRRRVKVKGL